MDAPFPSPPHLDRPTVHALVAWLDAMGDWLSAEHATAAAHGHEACGQGLKNSDLYRDAALLFREAYDQD